MIKKKSKKFNAFKGKRYIDYDLKEHKKLHFGNKKYSYCNKCGKRLTFETGYYGFNRLLCKKHYAELEKKNHDAVKKMVNRL